MSDQHKITQGATTPYHWFLFSICVLAYFLSGTVSMLISVYLPAVVRDLLGDASETRLSEVGPYINAAFLFGMMLGGLTLGVVSDRIGRVRTFAYAAAIAGLFTGMTAFEQDWHRLVVFRFLAGAGVAGILLVVPVLIAEVWEPKRRAVIQGLISLAYPVGIILAGGLNVVFPDWRTGFWLGIGPLILAGLIKFGVQESASWQQAKTNDRGELKTLFHSEYRRKLISAAAVYGSVLIGLWAIFSWTPTWMNTLVGDEVDAGAQRGMTMMILGTGGMLGTGLSGFLVNRFGMRPILLTTFAALFVLSSVVFLGNTVFSNIIFLEVAALAVFFGISQGALSVYVTELFPSAIRATATGFCFNIGRVFTASAVFFVGALVTMLSGFGHAVFVFSFAFLIAFAVLFFEKE
jgi:MFS family permease